MSDYQASIVWYDFESWGANPAKDRPSQIAAIRTDHNLNIIEDPMMLYCQLADDYLPHPQACLVTGLTPQVVNRQGIPEAEFAQAINKMFSRPNTVVAGYNSIRFDDELARHTFYRNFIEPYEREWKNGNSRWDIIDLVRACYALRPEGIQWPEKEDGSPSFRLEDLTKANGLDHGNAHDALSDVYATIALAKLIKEKQPKLYQFYFGLRSKRAVGDLVDVLKMQPLVNVSAKIPAIRGCTTWIAPIAYHPTNKNEVICVNLQDDINPLIELDADEIRSRLYTKHSELGPDELPIPLKNIHLNKCPFVAPAKTLLPENAERLGIDRDACLANLSKLKEVEGLREKLAQVYEQSGFPESDDVDFQLYNGFMTDSDKRQLPFIQEASPETLASGQFHFDDEKRYEMLFRYRARNYPHTLNAEEQMRWQSFCRSRLSEGRDVAGLSYESFVLEIENLAHEQQDNPKNMAILKALYEYVS